MGPVDIVIENNRSKEIRNVGYPKVAIKESNRPDKGVKEIDAAGMYVLPGLVDCHAHIGGFAQGTPAEYVYKLWMAHGVTTIRDPGSMNGVDWTLTLIGCWKSKIVCTPNLNGDTAGGGA